MSDQQADATATEAPADNEQQPKPEGVEELQAKLAKYQDIAKTQEKRAKENAAAAKRLAELEDAQKSEAEKAADRVAKAEAEVAGVPAKVADALRTHLVALHGIEAEDAELFLTATDPEVLLKQVARLVGQSDKQAKKNYVPREGSITKAPVNEERAAVRDLFGA